MTDQDDYTKRRDELALEYAEKLQKKVEQWPDKNAMLLTNWPGVWSVGYDKGLAGAFEEMRAAYDEEKVTIDQLRTKLTKARTALEPFAMDAGFHTGPNCTCRICNARKALEEIGNG